MNSNKMTNLLGYMVIIAATVSVFLIPEILWWDAIIGIFGGSYLIWFKNNKARDLINKALDIFSRLKPSVKTKDKDVQIKQEKQEESGGS